MIPTLPFKKPELTSTSDEGDEFGGSTDVDLLDTRRSSSNVIPFRTTPESDNDNDTTIPRPRFDRDEVIGAATLVGTTTLIGVAARAVRATAMSGWVQGRPSALHPHGPSRSVEVNFSPIPKAEPIVEPIAEPIAEPIVAEPMADPIEPSFDDEMDEEWAEFERIGLGPKRRLFNRAQMAVVGAYRMLGFAILTLIVVVLVGYIATTIFYFASTSWIMPVAVSESDDKVVALKSQLAEQQNLRDRLAADLADTERAIVAQQAFQSEFAKAIRTDLEGRQNALRHVRNLASAAAATRTKIRETNDAYVAAHTAAMAKEFEAGLIDRSTMLGGKQQIAQITSANLALSERQSEFEQRAVQLAIETRALDQLLANKSSAALSYDVLKIKRDYDASKLELQKATANRQTIQTALARQDEIIKGVQQSSYLRALADKATVALVPYDNLSNVEPGTKLYGCRVQMVMCHQVGAVIEVLPGEVSFKHPHRDLIVRGKMIELRLTEPDAAERAVLFLGSAPLVL
jgi:hypothetical protein